MKRTLQVAFGIFAAVSGIVLADTFGNGANQFTIDFVNISGDSGDLGSWSAGYRHTFSGVNHGDYRMGKFEITNDQWSNFKNSLGVPVTGSPSDGYDDDSVYTGANVPVNNISWYEAAQFVNWLNTSNGYQAAYKFTGTQGTDDYSLDIWEAEDAWGGTNLYRHKDAYYFLPTKDEWVKAAYWNGTLLQIYATSRGNGPIPGVDSNYNFVVGEPWDVGSGSEELNGTYDMMGNVWEWLESPFSPGDYAMDSNRCIRGSSFGGYNHDSFLKSFYDSVNTPDGEFGGMGFRVASVPEPCSLMLLGVSALALRFKWSR